MEENQEKIIKVRSENETSAAREVKTVNLSEFLAGKTFSYYCQKFCWLALVAVIISILISLIHQNLKISQGLEWFLYLIMYLVQAVAVSWLIYRTTYQDKLTVNQAVVLAGLTGLTIGLLIAIFRLIWQQHFWQIFNLFFEPLYSAVASMGLALIVHYLALSSLLKKNL